MSVLVTGGSGLVGRALVDRLLAQGHAVSSLSRHDWDVYDVIAALQEVKRYYPRLRHIPGDVLQPGLGIAEDLKTSFDACYHLAGIVNLGPDKDGVVWRTNVEGTRNVVNFCSKYQIPHLYFCSTAYTQNRNPYEVSKRVCELMVTHGDIPKVTIFKPSIVLGGPEQHFSQFVSLLIRIHRLAEIVRRKIEGTLRLPVIEPVFRIKGDPEARINLVTVESVADAMASIQGEGVYWLTNPSPPTLKQLTEWVGEFIMVRLLACPSFAAMPIEFAFQRMTRAFQPYLLENTTFHSDMTDCNITEDLIRKVIRESLGFKA